MRVREAILLPNEVVTPSASVDAGDIKQAKEYQGSSRKPESSFRATYRVFESFEDNAGLE